MMMDDGLHEFTSCTTGINSTSSFLLLVAENLEEDRTGTGISFTVWFLNAVEILSRRVL
jgi:hypothetical protein